MFVAYTGGERHRAVEYAYFLKAYPAMAAGLRIVAGISLQGVEAGTGRTPVACDATSERLLEVVQRSGRQLGTRLSTREPGLHADWPAANRAVPGLTLSWSGADGAAHTPQDDAEHVELDRLAAVGRIATHALAVLATDPGF